MSVPGQSRHFGAAPITSGLLPGTDIRRAGRHVSNVPTSDIQNEEAALVASFF